MDRADEDDGGGGSAGGRMVVGRIETAEKALTTPAELITTEPIISNANVDNAAAAEEDEATIIVNNDTVFMNCALLVI